MVDDSHSVANPFSATTPYSKTVQFQPQSGERGLKTVSTLFIVFGIIGLLTLPGILLGAALQVFMPNFGQFGSSLDDVPVEVKVEVSPDEDNQSPQAEINSLDETPTETIPPVTNDATQNVDPTKAFEEKMQEIQKFNPFGYLLGLVNVALSGMLLWAGVGLSKRKLSAAKMGIRICNVCCIFEIARLLLGAWINFHAFKTFMSLSQISEPDGVPIGMIMAVSIVAGFVFTLLYGVGKIIMYVLCARFLSKPHVQAMLAT